jgi:hypothetical protein
LGKLIWIDVHWSSPNPFLSLLVVALAFPGLDCTDSPGKISPVSVPHGFPIHAVQKPKIHGSRNYLASQSSTPLWKFGFSTFILGL